MSQTCPDTPPRWLWPAVWIGVGVVALLTAGAALWIAGGGADPPVAGRLAWADPGFAWAGGGRLVLHKDQAAWFAAPAEAALPAGPFTLDVTARLDPGADPSAAWGVWIAEADGARVVYAISGEGYTTTRRCPAAADPAALDDCPALRPEWRWMPYNRLKPPGSANMITLHVEASGLIRLRLNREIMGLAPVTVGGTWGVWVRGGRAGQAVLSWEGAMLYRP